MILGAVPQAEGPQPGGNSGQFFACRDMDGDMKKIAGL